MAKAAYITVPDGANYDMRLGPAPWQSFNPNRCNFQFRGFWGYGAIETPATQQAIYQFDDSTMAWQRPVAISQGPYQRTTDHLYRQQQLPRDRSCEVTGIRRNRVEQPHLQNGRTGDPNASAK